MSKRLETIYCEDQFRKRTAELMVLYGPILIRRNEPAVPPVANYRSSAAGGSLSSGDQTPAARTATQSPDEAAPRSSVGAAIPSELDFMLTMGL